MGHKPRHKDATPITKGHRVAAHSTIVHKDLHAHLLDSTGGDVSIRTREMQQTYNPPSWDNLPLHAKPTNPMNVVMYCRPHRQIVPFVMCDFV